MVTIRSLPQPSEGFSETAVTRRVGGEPVGIADYVPPVEGNVDSKTDKYRNVDEFERLKGVDAPTSNP